MAYKRRTKRCKVCLKPLQADGTCKNLTGCPLAQKQAELKQLKEGQVVK